MNKLIKKTTITPPKVNFAHMFEYTTKKTGVKGLVNRFMPSGYHIPKPYYERDYGLIKCTIVSDHLPWHAHLHVSSWSKKIERH